VDPELGVRPPISGKLIAFDVELEQVVHSDESGAHTRWKNKSVGSGNARAYMAKRRSDPLLVQNMAGGDYVLFDSIEIHGASHYKGNFFSYAR
jgi:hypothetical protein